jgi:hypothetical protein
MVSIFKGISVEGGRRDNSPTPGGDILEDVVEIYNTLGLLVH